MANFFDILKQVGNVAYDAQTGGLQVSVKTNLGPEFDIWDGRAGGGSLAQALGIRGAIIVRDRNGTPIFVHGEVPKTNLLLAGALLAGVSYLGYLVWRGATRRR